MQFCSDIQLSMQNADKTPPKLLNKSANPAGSALVEQRSPPVSPQKAVTATTTTATNNRMPGNIVCGICGAVRYYAFILQVSS